MPMFTALITQTREIEIPPFYAPTEEAAIDKAAALAKVYGDTFTIVGSEAEVSEVMKKKEAA